MKENKRVNEKALGIAKIILHMDVLLVNKPFARSGHTVQNRTRTVLGRKLHSVPFSLSKQPLTAFAILSYGKAVSGCFDSENGTLCNLRPSTVRVRFCTV